MICEIVDVCYFTLYLVHCLRI